MLTKWRVIKKATWSEYDYIGIEFNMQTGLYGAHRVHAKDTAVRKRTTSQFEVLENGIWETLSVKEAMGFIHDFNKVRQERTHYLKVSETDILALLYKMENMLRSNKTVTR